MKRPGWTLLTFCLAVITACVASHHPWKQFQEMRNESHSAVVEAKNLEAERAQLLHENARLDSPSGMEEVARSKGYRLRNETRIEFNSN